MSYAIHAADDALAGFLLFSDEGDTSGDCIFRAFPSSNTPVSELIHKLQEQGEFSWRAAGDRVCILSADGSEIGFISDGHLTIGE
jgi:hypothetical protein